MNYAPNLLGHLNVRTGKHAGETFPITKLIFTLGRDAGNDVVLLDSSVSRQHARISRLGQDWVIEKLATQNNVYVNQHDVEQMILKHGDILELGGEVILEFVLPANAFALEQVSAHVLPANAPASQPSPLRELESAGVPSMMWPAPASRTPDDNVVYTQRAASPGTGQALPSLEISINITQEYQVFALTKPEVSIGRDSHNDIVIDQQIVSTFHAQILAQGSEFVLVHPHPNARNGQTLNGLLYQGTHVRGHEPFRKTLTRGDVFRIGDENGTLVTLKYNDGAGAEQEALPDIQPLPLGMPSLTIGRAADNMLVLNHPQVSAHHARLEQLPNRGYRILDLGSTNHVYVNTERVSSRELKPNDDIYIGPFKLTYTGTQLTQQDSSRGVRIDALHLKKTGNNHTILINDISFVIPPRTFVALVGGSGAGKSTLLDALNGQRPANAGTVLYNGQDYYHSFAAFSTQLGYVPQEDIVHRDLTVERALYYAAKLRLPKDYTSEQIQQRINEVLAGVEMRERRHLLISKLSGGQRKRISIALELLAQPSIFFLDEPTSGLDPGLDRKMMFLLRKLADKGHTIVLVTHATNNINSCDYICFLAKGGRLAYFGPPNGARAYFGKADFAEIYGSLEPTEENPQVPAQAEARFKASPEYQQYVATPLNQGSTHGKYVASLAQQAHKVVLPKRGNPWKQFCLLSARYLHLLFNDKGNLAILLLQAPIIAIILYLLTAHTVFAPSSVVTCPPEIYRAAGIPRTVFTPGGGGASDCQNVVNFLHTDDPKARTILALAGGNVGTAVQFFVSPTSGYAAQTTLLIMAFAAVMFGCINGAREIVKEEQIYRRERAVNLGIAPYLFSKIGVLGVLCAFQSAILVATINAKAPFPAQGLIIPLASVEMYLTMFLTSLTGLMMGLAVSALAPNNDRATSFIPILLIPQVIFSGVIFPLSSPPLQIIGSFFADRWAVAAMDTTIGVRNRFPPNLPGLSQTNTNSGAHLLSYWGVLLLMSLLLGAMTAYCLKRKDVRRKAKG